MLISFTTPGAAHKRAISGDARSYPCCTHVDRGGERSSRPGRVTMSGSGQVGSNEDRPLFCHDWTARQEHKLLESIEEYGYGNW